MYLDIIIGLLVGLSVSELAGGQDPWLIPFAVFAALAPDADFIAYLIRNRGRVDRYAHEHRDLFHRPLLFSVGGGILVALFDPAYGTAWFLGTLWHFIHDTYDGGWGIRWADPFSPGYFTLASYSPKRYFRDRTEQRETALGYGNPGNWWFFRLDRRTIAKGVILISLLAGLWYRFLAN